MRPSKIFGPLFATAVILFGASLSFAQDRPAPADDVVRVRTELVQTDVTVVDRRGRFVAGLGREQFELTVNGKPRSLSFFEPVLAQPAAGEKSAAAPGGTSPRPAAEARTTHAPGTQSGRGRTILFFVDDVHLAPENLIRARRALLEFFDTQMGPDDQAAVVSTSGQVGFLQQLTDNAAVLREAASRLSNRRNTEAHAGKVQISEYDAAQVAEAFNHQLFNYLVKATMAEYQTDEVTASNMVRNRAHQIAEQSRVATSNTLGALEGLMRSSAQLPGRKVVFFISDGFVTDPRSTNALERLRGVTKTAAEVGAVIYTMDARGTFVNIYTDASQNPYPDFTGSVSRNVFAEGVATQEALRILADDTGGRAILNSNSFGDGFRQALVESSDYYLLAWRPEGEEQQEAKSRVEVRIKGRADLKVRVRRGFISAPGEVEAKQRRAGITAKAAERTPEDELRAALASLYPVRALPVALSVGYASKQKSETTLTASMQIDAAALTLDPADKRKAEVDVLGVALDDRGAIHSFKQTVTISPDAGERGGSKVITWNQPLAVAPGLYQVRVAVRERASGRTGSAMQWLEVPNLSSGQLQLGSLFLGEREPSTEPDQKPSPAPRPVTVNASRRFARASLLRFQTSVYNATHSDTARPDIEIHARVLRADRAVISLPTAKLPTDTTPDPTHLPYWAEVYLGQLPPGKYVLQVTATDRKAKSSTSQRVGFVVE
ncbi:MAG TPA: VWA domain-containing protein [Pyrinomonadaceae bacterium]|nr:VWA domain-containing protein [Pyrinomonadaceae bacterium]